MIDTIIISGGNIQNGFALDFLKKRIEESRGEKITLVAADKGMEWFMKNREFIPDLAIGDFDSLSEEGQKYIESLKGPDHVLANLGLLSMGKEQGVRIAIADQWNYITLAESGTILHREEQFGKYVSFFSVGGDVAGLSLKGFKYPLNRYHLTVADSGLTVSNEITEETAEITYDSGQLLMIMSRD